MDCDWNLISQRIFQMPDAGMIQQRPFECVVNQYNSDTVF